MTSHETVGRPWRAPFGAIMATLVVIQVAGCLTTSDEESKARKEPNMEKTYVVHKAVLKPELTGQWDSAAWAEAETFLVRHFHEKSSDHHPKVEGKMLYADTGAYVIFRVDDRYVVSRNAQYQGPVCRDSCVEFFVQPKSEKGYFNFEVNCGGTLLLQYHERDANGKDVEVSVSNQDAQRIRIYHSMPETVVPEVAEATTWCIEYFVPFSVFERHVGSLGSVPGQAWRANFYKCADQSSHPHWGAWAPIGEVLSFHQPRFFGTIQFAK